MAMKAHESDSQLPPATSLGVRGGELAVLTQNLESRLASIDSKLDRLLQDAVKRKSAPVVGAESASSKEGLSLPAVGKGWLAVTASGGCSPRWSEHADVANLKAMPEQNLPVNNSHDLAYWDVQKSIDTQPEESTVYESGAEFQNVGKRSQGSRLESIPSISESSKKRVSDDSTIRLSDRVMDFITSQKRKSFNEKLWNFFQDPDTSTTGYIYERFMRLVIVASMITTLLQTLPDPPISQTISAIVESTFEIYFLLELIVRFIASPNYKMFWLNSYNWIDLVSGAFIILRASLGFVIPIPKDCHLRCSLLVGFCPVARSLKMLRRMRQFHLLYKAFIQALEALQPLLSMYCFLLLVFTGFAWVAEPRSNLSNFPAAAWFIFVSMTTVGYGDVTPDTAGGAVIVAVSVVSSFLYMAIPVGIIGNAFHDVWRDRERLFVLGRARERLTDAGYKASELPQLFQMFDNDKNGQLDAAEFCWMIQGLKLGLTGDRRRELFKAFDDDANGGVSHKEFVRALFPESVEDIYGKQSSDLRGSTITSSSFNSAVNSSGIPHYMVKSMKKKKMAAHERRGSKFSVNERITELPSEDERQDSLKE